MSEADQYRCHQQQDGQTLPFPLGKVLCIGKNYHDHILEMGDGEPPEPLYFMKPVSAYQRLAKTIRIPTQFGECHNELELALLVGERISNVSAENINTQIVGVGLALDLTLRDVQNRLKKAGQPWEKAKAFDGSCPLSRFIPITSIEQLSGATFSLNINDRQVQSGNSQLMIHSISSMLADMSRWFTLEPGDVVLTGTPKGVQALVPGDTLDMVLQLVSGDGLNVSTKVMPYSLLRT